MITRILHGYSARMRLALLSIILLTISACSTAPPAGITAVTPFAIDRYVGTWYEIARLDHSFERGLSDVTATYRRADDGSVTVLNRGYDKEHGHWREAKGRALFLGDNNRASLKVSFFGPFYGGYHVVALDPQYRWAMVAGPSRDYLWILARDKQLPSAIREQLLHQAQQLGFATQQLLWIEQTRSEN
jgi:apolipoprotein D and lipocalin family protein